MTSNIADSVNAMFDEEREFPIVALVDEINKRFALSFHQRLWNWCTMRINLFPPLKNTY